MKYLCLLVISSMLAFVTGSPYPLHMDILTDTADEERVTNITNTFLTPLRISTWNAYNVHPITFNVHVNSSTPGINSYTTRTTTSSVYIDLQHTPSDVLCILSKYLRVAYIRTSVQLTNNCQPTKIRPSVTEYLEAAHQIFEFDNEHYHDVIFIHEYIHEFDLRIFQRKSNSTLRLMQFRVTNGTVQSNIKQFMEDGNTQQFIVFVSYDTMKNILQTFKGFLITRLDNWIMIPTDGFDCPADVSFTFSMICMRHDANKFNITSTETISLDDALLQKSLELIEKSVLTFSFSSPPSTLSLGQKMSWHIKSVFEETGVDEEMTLIEMLTTTHNNVSRHLHGNWTRSGRVVLDEQPFGPTLGSSMTVVLIQEPPFVEKVVNASGTYYRGYAIDILDKLADRMNFTYKAYEVRDLQYGIVLPNGSWTGIIGDVMRGEADLGIGPISITAEREEVIDFTSAIYDYAGLQILMSGPVASRSMFGFVDVFDGLVWLVWFGFLGLTSLILYLFHVFMFKVFSPDKGKKEDPVFTTSDTLWFIMASVTINGPDKNPGTFAGRVLVIGFWFFCQIMMATYTANMAAFMTSRRLTTGIDSLHDLASQNTIKYSSLSGSVSELYFSRMKGIEDNFFQLWKNITYHTVDTSEMTVWDYPLDDLYTRIFLHINETGFLSTSHEGVQRVLKGDFAFIHETPMIKYELARTCNLVTVGEVFSSKPYAFVLPQNSPVKDAFNAKILELQAEAFFEERKEIWWSEQVTCPKEDDTTAGLPFENLAGIFIMTGIGFGAGIIVLGIEILVHKWQKKKEGRSLHKMRLSLGALKKSYIFQSFTSLFNKGTKSSEKIPAKVDVAVSDLD